MKSSSKTKIESIKKIDLGAANDFGKKESSKTKQTELIETESFETLNISKESNKDLLEDIFSSQTSSVNNNDNFADFSQFQSGISSNTKPTSGDEFADFTSAFSVPTQPAVPNVQVPQVSQVMPPIQPANSLLDSNPFAPVPAFTSPLQPTNQSSLLMQPPFDQSLSSNQTNAAVDLFGTSGNPASDNDLANNTWSNIKGNLNINVDNLLESKYERSIAPSMNQLAAGVGNMNISGNLPQPRLPLSPGQTQPTLGKFIHSRNKTLLSKNDAIVLNYLNVSGNMNPSPLQPFPPTGKWPNGQQSGFRM